MAKIDVTVQVEKETYELGKALAELVVKIKEKAADGLSVADVIAAVSEEMGALIQGVSGIDQLPAESREDLEAFATALSLPVCKVLGAVAKKPAAPAPAPAPEAAPA